MFGKLFIRCKDLRQLKLDIQDQNDFINVADTLEKLSGIGKDAEISLHKGWSEKTFTKWNHTFSMKVSKFVK